MRPSRLNVLAILVAAVFILAACGQEPAATPTPEPPEPGVSPDPAETPPPDDNGEGEFRDSITIALDGQVRQVSNANTDVPTGRLLGWLYDALYSYNDELAPVPQLADGECEVNEDETVYTCSIIEATFHNGDTVTADDVAFVFELSLSDNCSYNPSLCFGPFIDSVEVIDDRTVEFTLPEPYSPMLTTVLPGLGIESRSVIEAAYDDFAGATEGLTPEEVTDLQERIAEATGAEEPDAAACEELANEAEEILEQAEAEIPERDVHTTDGQFDACAYVGELAGLLGAVARALEAEGTDAIAAAYRLLAFNKNPVGAGPYQWDSFTAGQNVIMTAYEDYHAGAPATQTINWQIITDQVAMAAALDTGQVDIVFDMNPDAFQAVEDNEDVKFAEFPGFVHLELQFNVREERVFGDRNLREAMALCIDKPATVEAATDGLGIPVEGPIPPASWAYNADLEPRERDVDAARALIEESGWTEGADGVYEQNGERLEFEALVREGQSDRIAFMQLFAEQVRDCGIAMTARPADFATVLLPSLDAAHTPQGFDVYFGGWFAGFDPDPYALFHCDEVQSDDNPETFNYIGYCNPEVDELIEEGLRTSDLDERRDIYFRFQEILYEEQPYLFAYSSIVRDGMHAGMTFVDGDLTLDSPNWLWQPHLVVIEE